MKKSWSFNSTNILTMKFCFYILFVSFIGYPHFSKFLIVPIYIMPFEFFLRNCCSLFWLLKFNLWRLTLLMYIFGFVYFFFIVPCDAHKICRIGIYASKASQDTHCVTVNVFTDCLIIMTTNVLLRNSSYYN